MGLSRASPNGYGMMRTGWEGNDSPITYWQKRAAKKREPKGISFGFFVSPRRKIHNILWHVKKIPGFSMFFFLSGPLCPGESCDIMTVTVIIYEGIYEY